MYICYDIDSYDRVGFLVFFVCLVIFFKEKEKKIF